MAERHTSEVAPDTGHPGTVPDTGSGTEHRPGCAGLIREQAAQEGWPTWRTVQVIRAHCGVSLLRAHRHAHGWTLDQAAEQLRPLCPDGGRVNAARVSHWERGETPGWRYLDGLCRLYRTRPDRLGFGADYSESDEDSGPARVAVTAAVTPAPALDPSRFERAPDIGREWQMERRTVVHTLLAGAAAGLTGPVAEAIEQVRRNMHTTLESTTVGAQTLDQWERTAFDYAHTYGTIPPLRLLCDVVADFTEVQALLTRPQPIEQRQGLCHVGAQFAGITGSLLLELGQHRNARSWFHTAQLAADETGDRALRAWVFAREATIPLYYGSPQSTVDLARRARAIAGNTPCGAVVRASALEARALAMQGRAQESEAAMKRAEAVFATLPEKEKATVAFGFTEAQLQFCASTALVSLGDAARAWPLQEEALRLYPPGAYVDPTLIAFDRAVSLIRDVDTVEGPRMASRALLDLPTDRRTDHLLTRGRAVAETIPPRQRANPAARDLFDLLNQPPGP